MSTVCLFIHLLKDILVASKIFLATIKRAIINIHVQDFEWTFCMKFSVHLDKYKEHSFWIIW